MISPNTGSSLTLCLRCIHKLFVEVGIPNDSFLNLLRPVIDPLMAIAAFPASHLRSLAQQCLTRLVKSLYLIEVSKYSIYLIVLREPTCSLHNAYIPWHSLDSDLSNTMLENSQDSKKPNCAPLHTSFGHIQFCSFNLCFFLSHFLIFPFLSLYANSFLIFVLWQYSDK